MFPRIDPRRTRSIPEDFGLVLVPDRPPNEVMLHPGVPVLWRVRRPPAQPLPPKACEELNVGNRVKEKRLASRVPLLPHIRLSAGPTPRIARVPPPRRRRDS